jgi:hypothetical protein
MNKKTAVRQISFALLLLTLCVVIPGNAGAQSDAVTVSLNPSNPGATIPSDFSGLSFEEQDLVPVSGKYYFVKTNQPLITLFNTLGVKSLRIGGNTADSGTLPANADIDAFFGFAEAANVKVLYTLRLKTFDAAAANTTATYIMDHYSADLTCFEIGNEPDVYLSSYSTYQSEAQTYIDTISASNPTAKFCGPGGTGGSGTWAASFAQYFASTGKIALVTHHNYFGGAGGSTTGAAARNLLLSATMDSNYATNANIYVPTVLSEGLSYRIAETNSFYNGGSSGCSNTFAEALWDLDYMYWWAGEKAEGLNFHTGDTVSGGTAYYSFFITTTGGYNVHPGAYGPLAFKLGGHGRIVPVTLSNPSGMDLTAYGVLASDNSLWVTIINKTHETGSITADLTINLGGNYSNGDMWLMQAPNNDDSQTTGITLGGGEVGVNGIWSGTSEPVSISGGTATLNLSPASAAVIQFVPGTGGSCTAAPSAPTSLAATAQSSSAIGLTWKEAAPPANCTISSYNVYRSTTSGFTPGSGNLIASGVTSPSYTNTGLTASTTYYYKVEALNSYGTSPASNQASATTKAASGSCITICIDSGSTTAVSPFVADEDFSGGSTIHHANTINTGNVTNPAPAAVYQTARVGATTASGVGATFTYTIPGFTAASSHTVRLHFAETYFTTKGSRVFNVSINGTQVLTNFDIVAASGGGSIANIQQFTVPANASGLYVITFTSVTNNALISGIEID